MARLAVHSIMIIVSILLTTPAFTQQAMTPAPPFVPFTISQSDYQSIQTRHADSRLSGTGRPLFTVQQSDCIFRCRQSNNKQGWHVRRTRSNGLHGRGSSELPLHVGAAF
jgi:hypothetical protein